MQDFGIQYRETLFNLLLKSLTELLYQRIKHYISAFGSMWLVKRSRVLYKKLWGNKCACQWIYCRTSNKPSSGLPYHEWFIEFEQNQRTTTLQRRTDTMRKQNIYYDDLIVGNILRKVVITAVQKWFSGLHEIDCKLGGQNKIPRLSDNRKIVDLLNLK
jgi:hypothetical protein